MRFRDVLHGNKYQLKEVKAKKTQTWPWHLLIRVLTALMPFKCRKKGGGAVKDCQEKIISFISMYSTCSIRMKREKKRTY